MTPDTAALRALAHAVSRLGAPKEFTSEEDFAGLGMGRAERRYYAACDPDTVRALCDAADEVERLRANGNGYLQRAHAAEAVIERMRCAHCGEVGCDWIGDIRKARAEMAEAERDASRAEVERLRANRDALREQVQRLRASRESNRGGWARTLAERDASRTAHAALVAELREAEVEWHDAWSSVALDDNEAPVLRQVALAWLSARAVLRALLDRHAPEETS